MNVIGRFNRRFKLDISICGISSQNRAIDSNLASILQIMIGRSAPAAPYNSFTTTYRRDISDWAGRSYLRPAPVPRELDVDATAAQIPVLARCLRSMRAGCAPAVTGTTLYRDSYVPHLPGNREIRSSYSLRCPEPPAPPDAPLPDCLRPTTEYSARYTAPVPLPPIKRDFACNSSQTAFRTAWNTSYRSNYCTANVRPDTSAPITFFGQTGLR
jgi:hypothetical protein